jgi:hypothetical protein
MLIKNKEKTCIQQRQYEETWGRQSSISQVESPEQILSSQPMKASNPVDISIVDFQPPDL